MALSIAAATAALTFSAAPAHADVWDRIAQCESGGNWHNADTGHNGHYGGLQFSRDSWRAAGGHGMPHHASKAEQKKRARILLKQQGWSAWTCAHAR